MSRVYISYKLNISGKASFKKNPVLHLFFLHLTYTTEAIMVFLSLG